MLLLGDRLSDTRHSPLFSVPSQSDLATGKIYQLAAYGSNRWVRPSTQFRDGPVAPGGNSLKAVSTASLLSLLVRRSPC